MADDIKKKIRELPQEVFYLLTADKAVDLNLELAEKYGLNGIQISAMVDLVEKTYVKELRLSDLYTQAKAAFAFDEAKLRQFICDLAGYKFLPIVDWLGEDVANYIRSLGGDAATYATENADLKRLAAGDLAADTLLWQEPDLPLLEVTNDVVEAAEAGVEEVGEIALEESIEQYKNILSTDLGELLAIDDYLFVQQFNYRLINLLVDHEDLKDSLIAVLLNNDLKIGTETIVIEGRQIAPTAGAWINYFISQKGSVMFDAVLLSDFLVNAANAKFLSAIDKSKLSRLLWLYRNIKFFPDSLVGDDPEKWELLPNVGDVNYKVVDVESNIEKYKDRNIESSAVNEVVKAAPERNFSADQSKVMGMKALAAKYPAGSLERLAIDEEIKRLTTL